MSKPYEFNISDTGGSQYNVGSPLLDREIYQKYRTEEIKKIVEKGRQLIKLYYGDDKDGYTETKLLPAQTLSGDLDTTPVEPIVTNSFPYGGTKSPGGLQNDIVNRPVEVRQYLSTGGIYGDPFPYTANAKGLTRLARLELRPRKEKENSQENSITSVVPEINELDPVTKTQTILKFKELESKWSKLLTGTLEIPLQTKLTLLLKQILYDVCYLKVKTKFPEKQLTKFCYGWLRQQSVLLQLLRESGETNMLFGDSFHDLVTGLRTLYHKLRERQDNLEVITMKSSDYNGRFY